jgi:hypothetical protein
LIANCDWPDEYPDLLTSLIALLSTGDPNSVHGAMAVFTEFIKSDLSEDQILPVLRQLLPVLLNILGDTDNHTALTRARTISVFRQCVAALYMVKDMHPQSIKEATASVLPVWLEAFQVLANLDPSADVAGPHWDGLAIRIQLFKVRAPSDFLLLKHKLTTSDRSFMNRRSILSTHPSLARSSHTTLHTYHLHFDSYRLITPLTIRTTF